jgi:hypothetical protein
VPVDGRVEAQAEEVLVVVRVDAWVDFRAVGSSGLAFGDGVGGEDAGEFDFELDDAVLVEDPVDAVFVVAGGEDLADDEFAGARGGGGFVAEVGVFEEDAVVFFMDADCVFDGVGFAVSGVGGLVAGFLGRSRGKGLLSDERGIQVLDGSLAITTHAERVGHVTRAVLAQVKGVFAVVRVVGVAVWHDHLGERDAPEHLFVMSDMVSYRLMWTHRGLTYRPHIATIVERNVRQDDPFPVVESDMEVPALPVDSTAIQLEGYAFRLGDVDRLEVISQANFSLD